MANKILFLHSEQGQRSLAKQLRNKSSTSKIKQPTKYSDLTAFNSNTFNDTRLSAYKSGGSVIQSIQPGPFRLYECIEGENQISTENQSTQEKPVDLLRHYDCERYQTCLNICAALDWDGFSCSGCCGEVNEQLLWRAQGLCNKDQTIKAICELPDPRARKVEGEEEKTGLRLVVDNTSSPGHKNEGE